MSGLLCRPVRAVGTPRQEAAFDERFQHTLAERAVDTAQALHLFGSEGEAGHFKVFSANALNNVRNNRVIHNTPRNPWFEMDKLHRCPPSIVALRISEISLFSNP